MWYRQQARSEGRLPAGPVLPLLLPVCRWILLCPDIPEEGTAFQDQSLAPDHTVYIDAFDRSAHPLGVLLDTAWMVSLRIFPAPWAVARARHGQPIGMLRAEFPEVPGAPFYRWEGCRHGGRKCGGKWVSELLRPRREPWRLEQSARARAAFPPGCLSRSESPADNCSLCA